MKLIVALVAFTAYDGGVLSQDLKSNAGFPAGLIPGDNTGYVEGQSRFIWMPDGNGVPNLIDLEEKPDPTLLQSAAAVSENQYWLYTRLNPQTAQIIVNGDADTIWASNYKVDRPLIVVVHGWMSNGESPINPMITDAFLSVSDCNVIVVDWSGIAHLAYCTSVNSVPIVGKDVGNFLTWLVSTAGGDWDNVHLVGHSLGAHVVGNAGRATGNRVARITGLDPAGPLWKGNKNALRASDGIYVEAIHTDGGLLGMMDPIGTTNFYPNGGTHPQPGCWLSTCSHSRSYELFAATIYHDHLIGRQCNSIWDAELTHCWGGLLAMGNSHFTKKGFGLYGLLTGSSWPF